MSIGVINRVAVEWGGSTFRRGSFVFNPGVRQVSLSGSPTVINVAFNSGYKWAEYIGENLGELPPDQKIVPLAGPGPVAEDMRTMVKFVTKQRDASQPPLIETNIPFAKIIEDTYQKLHGRQIEVVFLHDSLAGALGVVNQGGILDTAPAGTWFIPVIFGSGIGGNNYVITGPGTVEAHDGSYEFGHWDVSWELLNDLGLAGLLPDKVACGCDQVGVRGRPGELRGSPVCFESVAAGPALTRYGRSFFENLKIAQVRASSLAPVEERMGNNIAQWLLTPEELASNGLVWQALDRLKALPLAQPEKAEAARQKLAQEFDAHDFTAAIKATGGQEPISKAILERVAALFAHRFESAQRNHRNPLTFVIIGGAGHNLWPNMAQAFNQEVAFMNESQSRPGWKINEQPQLSVFVDRRHPDELNLYGAAYYLLDREARK